MSNTHTNTQYKCLCYATNTLHTHTHIYKSYYINSYSVYSSFILMSFGISLPTLLCSIRINFRREKATDAEWSAYIYNINTNACVLVLRNGYMWLKWKDSENKKQNKKREKKNEKKRKENSPRNEMYYNSTTTNTPAQTHIHIHIRRQVWWMHTPEWIEWRILKWIAQNTNEKEKRTYTFV